MTTGLDSKQYNGGVCVDGEGCQHHLVQNIILYPAQLLGHVPCPDEVADGGLLLAGHDKFKGMLEALLQIFERATHRGAIIHHPCLM